jgi:hypothetical protein
MWGTAASHGVCLSRDQRKKNNVMTGFDFKIMQDNTGTTTYS